MTFLKYDDFILKKMLPWLLFWYLLKYLMQYHTHAKFQDWLTGSGLFNVKKAQAG